MKYKLFSVLTLIFLFSLTACRSDKKLENEKDIAVFWVNAYRSNCDAGAGTKNCLMVSDADQWSDTLSYTYFYNAIEGFEFKPGYFQKIKVKLIKKEANNLPADMSNLNYKLIEVIQEKKDELFQLHGNWKLSTLNEEPLDGLDDTPRLQIDLATQKVYGNNLCNAYNGSMKKLDATSFHINSIAQTRKACPEEKQDLAKNYTRALLKARKYALQEEALILYDLNDLQVLRFIKE